MERKPQAVLITGAPGIGKSELVYELAAALLCETGLGKQAACGQCLACHWFEQNNHPDFRLLSPIQEESKGKGESAYEIKIAQIREIADFVNIGAHRAGRRIILLDPADALNTVSANALLKTLEEPTENMHFLLVSSSPGRLPATIRSRCLRYRMASPADSIALQWLATQSSSPTEQLSAAFDAAGKSPRAALSLLDPGSKAGFDAALNLIAALPEADLMQTTDRIASIDPRLWLDMLRRWTADIARVLAGAPPRTFPKSSPTSEEAGKKNRFGAAFGAFRPAGPSVGTVVPPAQPALVLRIGFVRLSGSLQELTHSERDRAN